MKTRHGFALVELAALALVASILLALILVFAAESRRAGRLGEDIGKLQRIGSLTQQYTSDNADQFWTYSWSNPVAQFVDIIQRRTGRTDISPPVAWFPHTFYSNLVLEDYAARVPDETFISAADAHRLKWSRDPRGFDQGLYQPTPTNPAPPANDAKRWPYSSSFALPICFFDRTPTPTSRIVQALAHNQFVVPSQAVVRAQLATAVVSPAHKVFLHDGVARHFGPKQPYCTHDQARLPLLFVDGSVAVRAAAESNPGWVPTQPCNTNPSTFNYQPDLWEPPTVSGGPLEPVIGRFRWTRGTITQHGIAGRDFAGPETVSCPP